MMLTIDPSPNQIRMFPRIRAIFATDLAGGMGSQASMPWPRLNSDLQYFKSVTNGGTVIMGRSTWDSDMPKPLPGRKNVVVTNRPLEDKPQYKHVITATGSAIEIINLLRLGFPNAISEQWWVIGGAGLLQQWLPYCEQVYYTRIHGQWSCDTVLAPDHWQPDFYLESSRSDLDGSGVALDFEIWRNAYLQKYC